MIVIFCTHIGRQQASKQASERIICHVNTWCCYHIEIFVFYIFSILSTDDTAILYTFVALHRKLNKDREDESEKSREATHKNGKRVNRKRERAEKRKGEKWNEWIGIPNIRLINCQSNNVNEWYRKNLSRVPFFWTAECTSGEANNEGKQMKDLDLD